MESDSSFDFGGSGDGEEHEGEHAVIGMGDALFGAGIGQGFEGGGDGGQGRGGHD